MPPPPTGREREVVSAGGVVLGPGRDGAAGAPPEVRRLVLPQGQARPRRARRPPPRCARSRRRPGSASGSASRWPTSATWSAAGTKRVHYWIGRAVERRRRERLRAQRRDRRGRLVPGRQGPPAADLRSSTSTPSTRRWSSAKQDPDAWSCSGTATPAPARPGGRTTATGRCWPPGASRPGRLVPVLAAYDVRRLVSSSSARCVADARAVRRRDRPRAAHRRRCSARRTPPARASASWSPSWSDWLEERPASAGGLVLCTHRPVLPWVFDALGTRGPGAGAG